MTERHFSVRELTELTSRSGDIDMRFQAAVTAVEGARLHRLLQKNADGGNYSAEVSLKITALIDDVLFTVSGRADGVITGGGGVIIDEIKTTLRRLDSINAGDYPEHWTQAKCYAYMYAVSYGEAAVTVRLTYYNAASAEIKRLEELFTITELEKYFYSLLQKSIRWVRFDEKWAVISRESMRELPFPFGGFRAGQRRFAGAVYKAVRDGFDLFAAAPTGTGKTVSTLYPAVRALGDGFAEKIFYMTAKETGRQSASDAAGVMQNAGLRAKTVVITARDKICPMEVRACDPERCPRARGHYDRVDGAAYGALSEYDLFSRELVSGIAEKYNVCPFELSLDFASRADIIICDYNHVFDPKAYLRRFFSDSENRYVFLADEAHNLPERARDMYSCEISKGALMDARRTAPKKGKVRTALNKLNKFFLKLTLETAGEAVAKTRPDGLDELIDTFILNASEALAEEAFSEELMSFYWQTLDYKRVSERFNDTYYVITRVKERGAEVRLYCSDPSDALAERLIPSRAAVFFSATLSPPDYYRRVLGARGGARSLALPSPFPRENFLPVVAGFVSTRYRSREASFTVIADIIAAAYRAKQGNYIAFFPSYEYLRNVFNVFIELYPGIPAVCQESGMGQEARGGFLRRFDENDGFTAFCVLGGIFSEGVDLRGERVVGIVVTGAGLPGLGAETEIQRERLGYDFAYTYPGFNRVLQAAGRLIRTETDRGAVVLIDDRFVLPPYPALFPEHWAHRVRVKNTQSLERLLDGFWNGKYEK